MHRKRKSNLTSIGFDDLMARLGFFLILNLLCVSFVYAATEPAYLTGLQVQSSPQVSKFTFILSKKVFGQVKFLARHNKILIELSNTQLDFSMHPVTLQRANVSAINYKKIRSQTLQFSFSVKEKPSWKIRYLPANKMSGVRLQLEIQSKPIKQKNTKINPSRAIQLSQQISNQLAVLSKKSKLPIKKSVLPLSSKKNSAAQFTIVIDAGHGGKDSGAVGVRGTVEKNIVLAIAKKLADKINQQTQMHAILTRRGDYFLSLRQRLKFARQGDASLFIAIHADAYFDKSATGASVYALSQRGATSEAAHWLAKRDNYSELDGIELDALKDRSSMLRSVLIDLSQTATIQDSIRLGNRVLDALNDISSLHYSQVEQAPFVVLKSPDIPSILVEVGFMTNPVEERRLSNARYQQKIAQALLQGIDQYLKKYGSLRTKTQALSSLSFHSIVRDHLLYVDSPDDAANPKTNAPLS